MNRLCLMMAIIFLTGCVAQEVKRDQSAYIAAAPRSILVVPIVNKSLEVDASNYMLTTLPTALGEKGYYVFPVHTTKFVLEHEGFYESEKIIFVNYISLIARMYLINTKIDRKHFNFIDMLKMKVVYYMIN